MSPFSPWAAALAGFRLVRERPLAVLAWAAVLFAGRLTSDALLVQLAGVPMAGLKVVLNADPINMQDFSTAMVKAAPGFLAAAVAGLPFFAVVAGAIFRAYLRPAESRWGYLRLGLSEAAVLGLIVAINLVLAGGSFFVTALFGTLAALAGTADPAAAAAIQVLGMIAVLVVSVWLLTRLCLAWPMTFQARRVVLLRAWAPTKPFLWPILGAFVTAEMLMVLVGALLMFFFEHVNDAVFVMNGGTVAQAMNAVQQPTTLEGVFTPLQMAVAAFIALFLALAGATLQGVAVSAYHSLAPPDVREPPAV